MAGLRSFVLFSLAVVGVAGSYSSGQAAKKSEPATGSVTGTLTCADTNAPARLALVTLEPVPTGESEASANKKSDSRTNATAMSDLDGRFSMDKVAPGRYYVVVILPGYLNPLVGFDQDQLKTVSEETRKELDAAVPTVDVEADQSAAVTLKLERAAELSGTVLYDDGSPAMGIRVQLLRKNRDGKLADVSSAMFGGMGLYGANGITDDHGHYRMIGISPGEYAVQASLPTEKFSIRGLIGGGGMSVNMHGDAGGQLSIYSGNVFRLKDAKIAKVGEGEQVSGADITIPVAGLHIVRGVVTAKRDGHALNKGQVGLRYADDGSFVRHALIAEDGSFAFQYVPEGNYILEADAGADTEQVEVHPLEDMTVKQDKVIREYGPVFMPLAVQGDVTGLDMVAPDAQGEKVAQGPGE